MISLLTDFGLRDPSAAICKGVILGITPDAQVIDISHEVRKYAIRDGALLLWSALPYLPIGIHVAVVDPGVGTARRAIAMQVARGDTLIGPDNGLLLPGANRLGGPTAVRQLENERYRLTPVSSSFHGRDVFAPAAAHLAKGARFEDLGRAVPLDEIVRLPFLEATVKPGILESAVVYIDTFGNIIKDRQLRFNNFGGTLGGPVYLPHLYNGKNRTFFFFSWDVQRLHLLTNRAIFTVPTPLRTRTAASAWPTTRATSRHAWNCRRTSCWR